MRIYEAAYELHDQHILQKLAPYGVMARNELFSHKYRGTNVYNWVRSATYTRIIKPIPTVLFVRGNKMKIKCETQDMRDMPYEKPLQRRLPKVEKNAQSGGAH